MRRAAPALLALALAGCGPGDVVPVTRAPAPIPVPQQVPAAPAVASGPVLGQTASRLIARFGRPDADLREGAARKLQFQAPTCVLDAYLYPPRDRADPVVRHVDTRRRDGSPIDEASCVAILSVPGG